VESEIAAVIEDVAVVREVAADEAAVVVRDVGVMAADAEGQAAVTAVRDTRAFDIVLFGDR
jgi:hypothetical protein